MKQCILHAPDKEQIRRTLDTLYGEVFNQGKADLLPNLVAGAYIQHNPLFPNGTAPLAGYLRQAGSIPVRSSAWQLKAIWPSFMCAI